jgi:uncharacterized heparinase superfamily protein
MRRAQLYLHTLRYLHPAQIPARARLRLARAIRELAPGLTTRWRQRAATRIPLPASPPAIQSVRPLSAAELQTLQRTAHLWRSGSPTWLNQSLSLGWPPRWNVPEASQLWRYHLHYFDEAPLLAQGDAAAREALQSLIHHWIDQVPCGARLHRDAWHPYVVSLRMTNWLLAWLFAPGLFDGDRRFADSVRAQAVFLGANLETDVGGNHLLKNLKALAIAGACWPDWQPRHGTLAPFAAALGAQILADGVHYERSPMYHCQVLGDALEVLLVLRATRNAVPDGLRDNVARLVQALRGLTHPDRDIALLGDSAFGMSFYPPELEATWGDLAGRPTARAAALRHRPLLVHQPTLHEEPAERPPRLPDGPLRVYAPHHAEAHSGLVVLNTPRVHVVADVGALCPDELPAHAQADTFTFELSLDGLRLIVDAGVDEYAAGPWRAYYRSTRAHNTAVVDGEDSSECWGSFRAARRARVSGAAISSDEGWRHLSARHDGYHRLTRPVSHGRTFSLHRSGLLVVGDHLVGEGTHRVDRYLHLHPDVEVEPGGGSRDLVLRRDQAALRLAWAEGPAPLVVAGATSPPQGWYGERFGARRPSPVLVWSGSEGMPYRTAFALVPLDAAPLATPFGVSSRGAVTSALGELPPTPSASPSEQ